MKKSKILSIVPAEDLSFYALDADGVIWMVSAKEPDKGVKAGEDIISIWYKVEDNRGKEWDQ